MTSYLSRLSPIPGFPEYTGPHKVGTIDVEIPISELDSPSPAPDDTISTIQYRVFYPCEPQAKGKSVGWLPSPPRDHIAAYTRFLGAGTTLAEFISYIPRLLHYISIPVRENAPLLEPTTSNKRWPVVIFSHGLGGSRNAYSHLVGSLASHGVIVVAPEHRDGSTPISFIRDIPSSTTSSKKGSVKPGKRSVDYRKLAHTPSPEVEAGRSAQLKIRLWELGLVHDSLLQLDRGKALTNLDTSSSPLAPFAGLMDVHEPGKIMFAGHSFGATTMAQLVKSTFYSPEAESAPKSFEPIFTPSHNSSISQQITPRTPVVLLDVWCLPLRAASSRWLWEKPFPCYTPGGPGGAGLLAVESQAFFKWRVHFKATKRLLSPDPTSDAYDYNSRKVAEPHFYYPDSSAHLSQSDFGVLFPWVTKRVFAAQEPERVMRLNVRAILQLLRSSGAEVSPTSAADMEVDAAQADIKDDKLIFGTKQEIRGWNWLNTDVNDLGDVDDEAEAAAVKKSDALNGNTEPSDAVMDNEIMKEKTTEKL
ncbi:platelet-activating factor acetylhydrolase [Phlyctema vagabunda]|uniref:Putative phospholipase n=1 Tax=Phlyctema vagabunda TaxID=108571 RepID=A0ABR4PJ06_9HELO